MGPRQFVADQLLAKADVIRAMHERVQLCQDPQTEFAIHRESPGVSRINHSLTVHGHAIFQEKEAAQILDEVGKVHSKDSFQDLLRTVRSKPHSAPVNQVLCTTQHAMLHAQHTSEPLLQSNQATAGLLPEQPFSAQPASAAFLDALDNSEKPTGQAIHARSSPSRR